MNNNAKGLGFVLALLTFTLLAVACGSGSTATPSSTPESTQTPGPVLPTAQELKQDGQELFSAFFAAVEAKDGAALHGLLEADIREQCTPEQVEQSVAFEDDFPNLQVTAVFVDLEDPNRALAQVSLLGEPEPGLEGFASNIATTFPFPMVREDGKWRLGIPFFPAGEGCPLPESSSQEATATPTSRQLDAPPQPAFPRLEHPPGLRAIVSGSGGGGGEYSASALLETDMTLEALLEHYRQQVLQPDWKVQQETMDEGLAALTWTFHDEADYPWFGVLLVNPAEEGLWWVRVWMGGGVGDGPRMVVPDHREPPVPAPTRPN